MNANQIHRRKIVAYQEGQADECEDAIKKLGGTVYKRLSIASALVCTLPDNDAVLSSLKGLPCIKAVEDDAKIQSIEDKKT